MNALASDVIEYIYSTSDNLERQEMVQSFYGQYYLLARSIENQAESTDNKLSLKEFVALKPQVKDQILEKIEVIVQKLMEKGMSRHSIVQAITKDYVMC